MPKQYEVTVRKVIDETHIVIAEDAEAAEYQASCRASDSGCVEVLNASAREMTDGLLSSK